MCEKYRGFSLIILIFLSAGAMKSPLFAQEHSVEYEILMGALDEQQIYATAGLTINRMLYDVYFEFLDDHIPSKLQGIAETVWAINSTFLCTMWPHDGGHWARASQIGGEFVITEFGYPFPMAEMHLPDSIPIENSSLTSIGGHEINYLMRRQVHVDYYEKQYTYADDMIHAFIQDIFYPMYAFLITPADPEDPYFWTETRGDPLESTLGIFQAHEGRPPVMNDGTVDPELVRRYRESIYVSVIWPLLNPLFYQSLEAFGKDFRIDRGRMPAPKMFGRGNLKWSWGTHFHPSPLGYELYLDNYVYLKDKLYVFTLKTCRPYMNNSLGLNIPSFYRQGDFQLGLEADVWKQEIFGAGGGFVVNARYHVQEHWDFLFRSGWKSDGYQPGRRVDESILLLAGGAYRF